MNSYGFANLVRPNFKSAIHSASSNQKQPPYEDAECLAQEYHASTAGLLLILCHQHGDDLSEKVVAFLDVLFRDVLQCDTLKVACSFL